MTKENINWQKDCDFCIAREDNVILSSPTGSGKTARYENWALNKAERPIFVTSPIKSLSNQKYREFLSKGYKVGLETGDIKYIPEDGCDIICCTQEIYNNKYRDLKNSTLIIDEFAYIFENENRTRAYIDSLYFCKAKNILICSATLGNTMDITNYINNLTNRKFYLYENKERLTKLEYKGHISKNNIKNSLVIAYSKNKCIRIAEEICKVRLENLNKLTANKYTFHDLTKRNRNQIMPLVKKYNIDNKELIELTLTGIAYYYSELYPKEKMFIEELYENGLIDTIVGTDALSLGVNFPVQNVIFTSVHKYSEQGYNMISKNLFEQISGRAGRKGYYDIGYVYYCNDFFKNLSFNDYDLDLKKSYFELVNKEDNNSEILLTANIKNILNAKATIDSETDFIVKYSTIKKDYEIEKNKITDTINYIKSYDLAKSYLKRTYHNLKWDLGYYEALEMCTPKFKRKIDNLINKLMFLQKYFDKDIGNVYMVEYDYKTNCEIFMDVLMEMPIEDLIARYGKTFYDLLLLKKYISNLPIKYSSTYDITIIENIINATDYTVLHPNEFKTEKYKTINSKEESSKKQRKIYECPNYFERIIIEGKEYIKLFIYNDFIVVCDCSFKPHPLYYFSKNIRPRIIGFIKNEERLELLNNIDIESLKEEDVKDKVEGTKLYLKKKIRKK